jgi:hypothetical protein
MIIDISMFLLEQSRAQTKVVIIHFNKNSPVLFLKPRGPVALVLLLNDEERKATHELKSVNKHYNCVWLESAGVGF